MRFCTKEKSKGSGVNEKVSGTNISKIVDDLEAALGRFRLIANDLGSETSEIGASI
jgi:hypothetical protein